MFSSLLCCIDVLFQTEVTTETNLSYVISVIHFTPIGWFKKVNFRKKLASAIGSFKIWRHCSTHWNLLITRASCKKKCILCESVWRRIFLAVIFYLHFLTNFFSRISYPIINRQYERSFLFITSYSFQILTSNFSIFSQIVLFFGQFVRHFSSPIIFSSNKRLDRIVRKFLIVFSRWIFLTFACYSILISLISNSAFLSCIIFAFASLFASNLSFFVVHNDKYSFMKIKFKCRSSQSTASRILPRKAPVALTSYEVALRVR